MKNLIFIFIILCITSCRKEGLDVKFRTIFKSSNDKNKQPEDESLKNKLGNYTQFGDYLGSITPESVTAKFMTIRFTDSKYLINGQTTLIDVVSPNFDDNDPRRFADFSNGNTVEVVPDMFGNIDNDGWFVDDNIELKYLGIFPYYLLFNYILPPQYDTVVLRLDHYPGQGSGIFYPPGFTDAAKRIGNTMSSTNYYFMQHEYQGIGFGPRAFVFGGTDSSYVVSPQNIPEGEIATLVSMSTGDVARIGNYSYEVLSPPDKGKSKVITTTISFNFSQIIQYYAGMDNIPYTYDDIFVLVPNFWERFQINLKQE